MQADCLSSEESLLISNKDGDEKLEAGEKQDEVLSH